MEAHQAAALERFMNRYRSIHRDLRLVIEEATEKISAVPAVDRAEAVNELIDVLKHPGLKQYHYALICGLVAANGDSAVVDLADYATRCITACHYIMELEGLVPGSNARQPFEDLISGAKEAIERVERGAEADRFLEEVLRARDEQNLGNGELDEIDRALAGNLTDEEELIYGGENDDLELSGSDEETADDILNEVYGPGYALELPFHPQNARPVPAGNEVQEEEVEVQTVFQHDVTVEDAELIQAFISLVPENRELMQELVRKASLVAGIAEDQMIEQLQQAHDREHAAVFERVADEDESDDDDKIDGKDGNDGRIKIDIEIDLDHEKETELEIEINTHEF